MLRGHRELLNRLNLERLSAIRREDAEPEIRDLTISILEQETQSIPLSLFERDALIEDVQNELFGLGPLEELLDDPGSNYHQRQSRHRNFPRVLPCVPVC